MFHAAIDVDDHRMDFAAAGAPAIALVGGGAPATLLDGSGLPLGLAARARHPCRHAVLPPGCSLFLVSDALLEAPDADGAGPGEAGALALAERCAEEADAAAAVDAIARHYAQRLAGPGEDYLTAICLRPDTGWTRVRPIVGRTARASVIGSVWDALHSPGPAGPRHICQHAAARGGPDAAHGR